MPKYTGAEVGKEYEGVRIVRLPTIYGKFTETVLHELFSSLYALVAARAGRLLHPGLPHRVGLPAALAPAPSAGHPHRRPRLEATQVGPLRSRLPEGSTTGWRARSPSHLVSDSKELQKFYLEEYGTDSAFLTYGGHVLHVEDEARHREILATYDAEPGCVLPRRRPHGAGEQRRRHRARVRALGRQGAAAHRRRRQLQERLSRATAADRRIPASASWARSTSPAT